MKEEKSGILLLTRDLSYPGGTEVFVANYARHLLNGPFSVYLLEMDSHGRFSNKFIYKELEDLGLNYISTPDDVIGNYTSLENARSINNALSNNRLKVIHSFLFNADCAAWIAKVGSRKARQKLLNHANSASITNLIGNDIFSHQDLSPNNVLWVSSKFSEFSVALEQETHEWEEKKFIIDNYLEPIISEDTDQIICASSAIAKKWKSFNNNVKVIPCASISSEEYEDIQVERTEEASRIRFENKQLKFICVSRLVPGKGIESLIRGFEDYQLIYPNSKLTIVGEGPLLGNIPKGNENIKLTGHLQRNEVLSLLDEHDVFCLFSDSEGLPLSIQEAMSRRKVILATDVGGIGDLVLDGFNGYLTDSNSPSNILRTLLRLDGLSPGVFVEMGRNSKGRIKQGFLKESSFELNIDMYRKWGVIP